MWQDPIVEEVRKEREAYAAYLNYDIKAIVAELRKQQEANADKVVDFSEVMTEAE